MRYNPRRVLNAGLADGECLERLWAYLRKFSYITKSMSAGHRVDALSSALLHYTFRMKKKMSKQMITCIVYDN